jgi:hypothetical protein
MRETLPGDFVRIFREVFLAVFEAIEREQENRGTL